MDNLNKNQNGRGNEDDFIDDLELIPIPGEKEKKDVFTAPAEKKEEDKKTEDNTEYPEKKQEKPIAKEELSEKNLEISGTKIKLIKKLLENIKENNEKIMHLLSGYIDEDGEKRIGIGQVSSDPKSERKTAKEEGEDEEGVRIVEGIFDGENMIGPDGKQYNVPANYASKSKLVEGDILKLTITAAGTFIYKQIGPIERSRIVGILEHAGDGNYFVKSAEKNKKWRVLTASVTYFKGQPEDEVVILTPKSGESKWAAVDNIVQDKQ